MKRNKQAACAAVLAAGAAFQAHAWESTLNFQNQGTIDGLVWCYPNRPPSSPSFQAHAANPPNVNLGPGLTLCRPQTQLHQQTDSLWHQHTQFGSMFGDTVDWHSMLPFVTKVAPTAFGELLVSATITSPNSANFTVTWSGSNAGVAMHLGWFQGATLLHEELRIGPWSETIVIPIVTTGSIFSVVFESSGAAVTLAPGERPCGTADYNCDGDIGTDADIEAFFSCLGGTNCPVPPCLNSADFNFDGDTGTDTDIEAFFRVLAGGTC